MQALDTSATSSHPRVELWHRFAELACVTSLLLVTAMFVACGSHRHEITIGRTWEEGELIPLSAVDHSAWNDLLRHRVDTQGNVDYRGWKASAADCQLLTRYLNDLSRGTTDKPSTPEARLVYGINAYNALTVWALLREYPASSIHEQTGSKRFDIWRDVRLSVGNRPHSLAHIEHVMLRPLREPRIHFAIVCGARGCPRLRNEAYSLGSLENQLQENARHFFSQPDKLALDSSGTGLIVSPLLNWYGEDFGKNDGERLRLIAPYLPESIRAESLSRKFHIRYGQYDSRLNERSDAIPSTEENDSPGAPFDLAP